MYFQSAVGSQTTRRRGRTYVSLIGRKPVVDAGGEDDQVVLLDADADPRVAGVAHVEEAVPLLNVADLLVLVQVLAEERLDLLLVHRAHLLRRDRDQIAVLVAALGRECVDALHVGEPTVNDAQLRELVEGGLATRVVGFALVALASYCQLRAAYGQM
jgi:hypothetical protein